MNEYSLKRNVNKMSMKPSMFKPDEYWLNQKKLARWAFRSTFGLT